MLLTVRKDGKYLFFLPLRPKTQGTSPFCIFSWLLHEPFKHHKEAGSFLGSAWALAAPLGQPQGKLPVGGRTWLFTSSGHTLLLAKQSGIVASGQNTLHPTRWHRHNDAVDFYLHGQEAHFPSWNISRKCRQRLKRGHLDILQSKHQDYSPAHPSLLLLLPKINKWLATQDVFGYAFGPHRKFFYRCQFQREPASLKWFAF